MQFIENITLKEFKLSKRKGFSTLSINGFNIVSKEGDYSKGALISIVKTRASCLWFFCKAMNYNVEAYKQMCLRYNLIIKK